MLGPHIPTRDPWGDRPVPPVGGPANWLTSVHGRLVFGCTRKRVGAAFLDALQVVGCHISGAVARRQFRQVAILWVWVAAPPLPHHPHPSSPHCHMDASAAYATNLLLLRLYTACVGPARLRACSIHLSYTDMRFCQPQDTGAAWSSCRGWHSCTLLLLCRALRWAEMKAFQLLLLILACGEGLVGA